MRNVLKLGRRNDFLFLIIFTFVFFLLRLPSLFEPQWYGDEGIYQVIGDALNKGSLLYRDIWDNKPPFLYLLYALFNSDQFTLRLVSFVFGVFSVIIFFFLSKRLFPHFILSSSIFILLLGLPVIEGNIANAENFMLLPIITAAFLIWSQVKGDKKHPFSKFQIFISGILLGLAFLFKVVAIFDFLAFLTFFLVINLPLKLGLFLKKDKKHLISFIHKVTPFILGFLIPILVTVFYFWMQGAFRDFLRATFSSNIGYVAWQNKFIFPQVLLVFKSILLISAVVLIIRQRKILSPNTIFILLWFLFSLYNVFFTQRPYTHYLLTLLPSAALIIGLISWEKKHQRAITIFFILALVLVLNNFNLYKKTLAYYQNFTSFVTGSKSVVSYREFFDKRTPIDYEIAFYLKYKIRESESIFIWGDNAQVYKLLGAIPPGKYIASYHVIGNKDGVDNTRYAIEKKKPRFIIIMPDQSPVPFQLVHYFKRINIDKVSIYERFF